VSERHLVAMLTAVIRVFLPQLDGDAAVLQAIALARGGMGEKELTEAIETVLRGWQSPGEGWLRPAVEDILTDVDFAMGVRAYLQSEPTSNL
jgi:hypothetical protein